MKSSIEPTPGRMVLAHTMNSRGERDVLPAIIVRVFPSSTPDTYLINVKVIGDSCNTGWEFKELYSVPIVDAPVDGEPVRETVNGSQQWCEWMPFQKGQAAMTEKIAKQAGLATE